MHCVSVRGLWNYTCQCVRGYGGRRMQCYLLVKKEKALSSWEGRDMVSLHAGSRSKNMMWKSFPAFRFKQGNRASVHKCTRSSFARSYGKSSIILIVFDRKRRYSFSFVFCSGDFFCKATHSLLHQNVRVILSTGCDGPCYIVL